MIGITKVQSIDRTATYYDERGGPPDCEKKPFEVVYSEQLAGICRRRGINPRDLGVRDEGVAAIEAEIRHQEFMDALKKEGASNGKVITV